MKGSVVKVNTCNLPLGSTEMRESLDSIYPQQRKANSKPKITINQQPG